MTLDLHAILILGVGTLAYGLVVPRRYRGWALLVASLVAIYWLQPPLPIRHSDFILPTATIVLAVAGWWWTRPPGSQRAPAAIDLTALSTIVVAVLALSLARYVQFPVDIVASRPPDPLLVALALVGATIIIVASGMAIARRPRLGLSLAVLAVVVLLAVLKTAGLAELVAGWWRDATGRDPDLASPADLGWLGFSYVAFRLIHTFRDRQSGLLPAMPLRDYVTYIIFFPAYTAGPIDRAERFQGDMVALPAADLRAPPRYVEAGTRIGLGLLKKFVVADALATGVALSASNALDVDSTAWLWVMLYAYAIRLWLDFSGYTDIAIGLGILAGVRLPENFQSPYTRTNITVFWQSWHMTLSGWARSYVFSPLSRWMLGRTRRPPGWVMVLVAQAATMATIGLWHGVTWAFLAWGLWHAAGLFVHKQWSDRTRRWYRGLQSKPAKVRTWRAFGWFLTFHFVVAGWVFFLIPDLGDGARVLGRLVGVGW